MTAPRTSERPRPGTPEYLAMLRDEPAPPQPDLLRAYAECEQIMDDAACGRASPDDIAKLLRPYGYEPARDTMPGVFLDDLRRRALSAPAQPAPGERAPVPEAAPTDDETRVTTWMQHNYALCCEIARLEHELAIAVKAGHTLSTERGPYATKLLSLDRPPEAAAARTKGAVDGS